jgi:hypothetical protein
MNNPLTVNPVHLTVFNVFLLKLALFVTKILSFIIPLVLKPVLTNILHKMMKSESVNNVHQDVYFAMISKPAQNVLKMNTFLKSITVS